MILIINTNIEGQPKIHVKLCLCVIVVVGCFMYVCLLMF